MRSRDPFFTSPGINTCCFLFSTWPPLCLLPGELGCQTEILLHPAIWLKFKGSCALRGKGLGGGWIGDTFTGERISRTDTQTNCQDKARLSIEQSSSCMRADCASSTEHDPSDGLLLLTKLSFPICLGRRGTHFWSLY